MCIPTHKKLYSSDSIGLVLQRWYLSTFYGKKNQLMDLQYTYSMRKKIYVLEDVYNACKEEQQTNNPMVLIWLKPTYDFILKKVKCCTVTAWKICREIEETYNLDLKKADGYVVERKQATARDIWSEWMIIDFKNSKLGKLLSNSLRFYKSKYEGQELKEKMIKWVKCSKYKDQIQLIDSDNSFDDKPIATIGRPKTKTECESDCSYSELNDLCS